MKLRLFAFALCLVLLSTGRVHAADCSEKRETIVQILQRGANWIRHSRDRVTEWPYVPQEQKTEYLQNAEWVLAWTVDQEQQMERRGCEELSDVVSNIRVQWKPLAASFLHMRTSMLLAFLDELNPDEDAAAVRASLDAAKMLLLATRDEESLQEIRTSHKRAVFLMQHALRFAEKSGILE